MYSRTIFSRMEDVNFFQMHHVKWGEVVLLYNYMHKFNHILYEDCKVEGNAILYFAGLTTCFILYCAGLTTCFILLQ